MAFHIAFYDMTLQIIFMTTNIYVTNDILSEILNGISYCIL